MLDLIDGKAGDSFGFSVALSGDTALVGAKGRGAYVYDRSGTEWSQPKVFANSSGAENFGWSVALSGDTAIVGSPNGAAYVYTRHEADWSQDAILTPSDGGGPLYWYGWSVALNQQTSPEARVTVPIEAWIGAPGASIAYVYSLNPSFGSSGQTPFKTFDVKQLVTMPQYLHLQSTFTLGKNSDGISPITQALTLKVGGFTTIIPASSFSRINARRFFYAGQIDDVWVTAHLVRINPKRYLLEIAESGSGVSFGELKGAIPVALTIGNDKGETVKQR
jgi:hypothetical protein